MKDTQVVLRWMYMFDEDELARTDDVDQHA
jgi:hypothetical protein